MGRNATSKLFNLPPKSFSWHERLSALRYVTLVLKLVWDTHRVYALAIIVLKLVRSLTPVSILWVSKLIIDVIVILYRGGGDSRLLWKLVGLGIAIVVIRDLFDRASELIEKLLAGLFNQHTSTRLMAHAATLDLHHVKDPAFYDQLDRARQQTGNQFGLLTQLLSMVQELLTIFSLGAVLFVYSPKLLLLLVFTALPSFFGETHFAALEYLLSYNRAAERGHLDYLRYVGASNATAKEVQLFGLSSWLISRYRTLSQRFYDESKELFIRNGNEWLLAHWYAWLLFGICGHPFSGY
jgi:ATP-binding cassette, subfamily B, bacterial